MNKMSIFAEALTRNVTIKDKSESRINGGLVGVENFSNWKSALEKAHTVFYKYEHAKIELANGKVTTIKTEKDNAVEAYKAIVALIGEVNGVKLMTSIEAMELASKYAIFETEKLTGNALLRSQELSNLNKRYKEVHAGMNEDYVANLEKQIADKEAELKLEKKKPGSCKKEDTQTSYTTFVNKVETRLAKAIKQQSAKSYEDILAEREAQRALNRAKAKARRDANKKSEKKSEKPAA